MLITLQSNSDSDASDFVNYFKETVMIEPKSELALVNVSYKFENGITVIAGVNDTFQVSIGVDNDPFTCTVAPGEYTTAQAFADACTLALTTGIDNLPAGDYWKQRLFKDASQEFSVVGATSDRIKMTIQYAPENWDEKLVAGALISAPTRQQVAGNNVGIVPNFNQGILKRITGGVVDAYNVDNFASGYSSGFERESLNVMWATARDTDQAVPHGKFAFKVYNTDKTSLVVGFTDGDVPTNWTNGSPGLAIGVRQLGNGNLRIHERNPTTGNLQTIADNIAVSDGNQVEIHIDQMTDSSTDTFAKYYVGGTEITAFTPGITRWPLRPGLELVPTGSFNTPVITSQLVDAGGGQSIASCITGFTITNTGSGYYNGEVLEIQDTATGGTTELLATADANGFLTAISFLEHSGNFDILQDTNLTITGKFSGATNGRLRVEGVGNSVDLTVPGTGYSNGPADLRFDGVDYAGTATLVVNAGIIQSFTLSDTLPNVGLVETSVIQIIQAGSNDDAEITVNAVDGQQNLIYDVITDTIDRSVDEPLGLHNRATFTPSAGFQTTTGLRSVGPAPATPLTTEGVGSVNNGREDTLMLVNIEEFQLKSICKDGGVQKAIGSVPMGLTQPEFENGDPVKVDGEFYYEPYNMLYHRLMNPGVENHNQLRVRLTDATGNPLVQLKHPTTITVDLRPRAL